MVTIRITETQVFVTSDYNSLFVAAAKRLGGKWSAPEWVFDVRDEDGVRALCLKYYGDDGETKAKLVTVHFQCDHATGLLGPAGSYTLGGRTLVRRVSRDSSVQIMPGVIVLTDKDFPSSGGSVKHPCVDAPAGTILEVRDVSEHTAREYAERYPDCVKVVEETLLEQKAEVEIFDPCW